MTEPESPRGLGPRASLTIALAAIAATLAAGIVGSLIAGCQQNRLEDKRINAQSAETDTTELRSVIDKAANARQRAVDATNEIANTRSKQQRACDSKKKRRASVCAAAAVDRKQNVAIRRIHAMDIFRVRLTVRLGGSHPIARAYGASRTALLAWSYCVDSPAVPPWAETRPERLYGRAAHEFDVRVTDLLGSRLGTTPRAKERALGPLNRLEKELRKGGIIPSPLCI